MLVLNPPVIMIIGMRTKQIAIPRSSNLLKMLKINDLDDLSIIVTLASKRNENSQNAEAL